MYILKLILREIQHRKLNFILGLIAVIFTSGLFITFHTTGTAFYRETKRIMRNMGQNLRIIPEKTKIDQFWITGFSEYYMPEEYVYRFKSLKGFSYTHLTASLQKIISWNDMKVILTGILPEVFPIDKRFQKPMTFYVDPGTVKIGYEVTKKMNIKKGAVINISGYSFKVAECMPEKADHSDISIYGQLHDVQKILKLHGKINEIKALECLCVLDSEGMDMRDIAQKQLSKILPDAKVILLEFIAKIRQKQRNVVNKYLQFITPFLLVMCCIWIGFLSFLNVRERKNEIGILRAIGYNSNRIAFLFLGKAFLIGITGGIIGFFGGTAIAVVYGPELFNITAKMIKPEYELLGWVVLFTTFFTVISSFIPTILAITQDPALTLSEE